MTFIHRFLHFLNDLSGVGPCTLSYKVQWGHPTTPILAVLDRYLNKFDRNASIAWTRRWVNCSHCFQSTLITFGRTAIQRTTTHVFGSIKFDAVGWLRDVATSLLRRLFLPLESSIDAFEEQKQVVQRHLEISQLLFGLMTCSFSFPVRLWITLSFSLQCVDSNIRRDSLTKCSSEGFNLSCFNFHPYGKSGDWDPVSRSRH